MLAAGVSLHLALATLGAYLGQGSQGSRCTPPSLQYDVIEWQNDISQAEILVVWGFGNETCNSVWSCFHTVVEPEHKLVAQLPPLQIQRGVTLTFVASDLLDAQFSLRPRKVDEQAFKSCDVTAGTPIMDNFTNQEILVSEEFLQTGTNLFIAETSDPLYQCQFGFRLNVTVKEKETCHGYDSQETCTNRGTCISSYLQAEYSCHCCAGFSGQQCELEANCSTVQCYNNATCTAVLQPDNTTRTACVCQHGYHGENCQFTIDDSCEIEHCENNGTCLTSGEEAYECVCTRGFTGEHCEVDINDCAREPCGYHGICVDQRAGHACYCKPGYTGEACNMALPHCDVNHCQNGGVCVENELGVSCHCTGGYSGPDCSTKVDLCNPSPCINAAECTDFGPEFTCYCKPGFSGVHCEIDLNECESSPCQHGGKCVDMVSSFKCICPHGRYGTLCQYEKLMMGEEPDLEISSPWKHRSPLKSLGIIAGTLGAGVLLALSILLVCYCRVHETYKGIHLYKKPSRKGYTRHRESSSHMAEACSSLSSARPCTAAILEATSTDYAHNTLNQPVHASLRPKRV